MRRTCFMLWASALVILAGCVESNKRLVLDPVGPPLAPTGSREETGNLMVYSAFDPAPDPNRLPYQRQYTDYQIFGTDGKRLKKVHNQASPPSDFPTSVVLPVGHYRVLAHANGYGEVSVPVAIRPGQTTMLHLEGSANWKERAALTNSNPVRLPHGEIAGWRDETKTR